MEKTVQLYSILTCPQCSFQKEELMPIDACQFFYECSNCQSILKPKPGDCCVFCSYGSVPCPPVQQENQPGCCGSKSQKPIITDAQANPFEPAAPKRIN